MAILIIFLLGICFGVILEHGEIISWFRIQEMFRFGSFHMYGVIGSAIVVGAVAMMILRKIGPKTLQGTPITVEGKQLTKGTVLGGLIFGIGWAMTGACPGPLYALAGTGNGAFMLALLSAVGGALTYGIIRDKLPH